MTDRPPVPGSIEDYRALVAALLDLGYRVCGYDDARPDRRDLILRHDIDMSIDCAVALAEAERAMGVAATYFTLLRTDMYNPWSAAGREGIRSLVALGHDVGLHFDASLYPDDLALLDAACADECDALEQVSGAPVRMVSFHRPAKPLQGLARTIGGRRHAYEPAFFAQMGYSSDSNGAWAHGHPLDHDALKEGRALQLLTHPIWWIGEGNTAAARLDWYVRQRVSALDQALAANCRAHRAGRISIQVG